MCPHYTTLAVQIPTNNVFCFYWISLLIISHSASLARIKFSPLLSAWCSFRLSRNIVSVRVPSSLIHLPHTSTSHSLGSSRPQGYPSSRYIFGLTSSTSNMYQTRLHETHTSVIRTMEPHCHLQSRLNDLSRTRIPISLVIPLWWPIMASSYIDLRSHVQERSLKF